MPEQFQECVSRLLCRTGIRPDAGESFPTIRRSSHDCNKKLFKLYILIRLDRLGLDTRSYFSRAPAPLHYARAGTSCWLPEVST
jgi:hypothetical protein